MNIALIVAAGKGTRLNSDVPKQFIKVLDEPLFSYSLKTFHKMKEIDEIYIVTSSDGIDIINKYVKDNHLNKVKDIVLGGDTRQDSVRNGLLKIKENASNDDRILIHDAARALVSERIILDNIKESKVHDAVTTLLKVSDTMNISHDDQTIKEIIDRTYMYHGQTPQTFKLSLILKAHEEAKKDNYIGTDDVSLIRRMGIDVYFVSGERENFKITTNDDLILFTEIIKGRK